MRIEFDEKEARYVAEMLDQQHGDLMDQSYTANKKGAHKRAKFLHAHSMFVGVILQRFLYTLGLGSVAAHKPIIDNEN